MRDEHKDTTFEVLLAEYWRAMKAPAGLLDEGQKGAGFWVTLTVVAFGVGLKENLIQVFLLIPIAHVLMLFYLINIYERTMTMAGYLTSMEEKINSSLGQRTLRWETDLSPRFHQFRLTTWFLIIVWTGLSIGMIVYALWRSYMKYPTLSEIETGFVALSLLVAVGLLRKLPALRQQAKEFCHTLDQADLQETDCSADA
jgi:magnesium-transporting ATPase (P-type)